ncbi:MAG: YlxR family protein [Peptoniphilaceae bacterium]|nr:YlxR family protein [Peptoniphilaceae bacterium]MDY6085544.1 YlxR family protein [Peptoniphilaceae bacterium]
MPKKEPVRRCVVCGEQKPKRELLRVVHTVDDEIVIDASGKLNGRGAYLCKSGDCLQNAQKKNRLKQALKTNVPEEFYEQLRRVAEE